MKDLKDYLGGDSPTVGDIYDYHKKMGDAESQRGYLGASILGTECKRQLWYQFRNCCAEELTGRKYRLFETGDLAEPRFVKELRAIGCTVHEVDDNGRQFELSALGGHVSGHMDGAVLGLPEAPKTWHVAEFKTHSAKSFRDLVKKGVEKSKPVHYAQVQIYMRLSGMTRSIYIAVNKDTDELYSERIKHDAKFSAKLLAVAEEVIRSAEPPERAYDRRDYYLCGWCSANEICWGPEGEVPALPVKTLSCKQCCYATPALEGSGATWHCDKSKRIIPESGGARPCGDHLIIPGLLSTTDVVEFHPEKNGVPEHVEHETNGVRWINGKGVGQYSSEKVQKLPLSAILSDFIVLSNKDFGIEITGVDSDLRPDYTEELAIKVWEGSTSGLSNAWCKYYDVSMGASQITRRGSSLNHRMVEYRHSVLVCIHEDHRTAYIMEKR